MVAVIDNYDSFTYNLVHYIEAFNEEVTVYRNDEVDLDDLENYSHIVISPGPGLPNEVPILDQIIKRYATRKNILGVCLGMQALVVSFGGELYNLHQVLHGHQGECRILKADPILKTLPDVFQIGHYHSWGVNDDGLPINFEVIARDSENRIMIIKHKKYASYGIQFHPESILCPKGKKIIQNWLEIT